MKHILDSSFHYRPSFDTDVRKTFDKVRKQQQAQTRSHEAGQPGTGIQVKVLKLDQLKKASGG